MNLSNLKKLTGHDRRKKRVGRGIGSGKGGHTSGRGQKGQKARKGAHIRLGFEGGQVPLYKRLPQLGGFRNHTTKFYTPVAVEALNVFENGSEVTPHSLLKEKVIKKLAKNGVKLLAGGKLEKKLTLTGFAFSAKAKELVEKSGSKINA